MKHFAISCVAAVSGTLLVLLGGCSGAAADDAEKTLSVSECKSLCASWDASQREACEADFSDDPRCSEEQEARGDACESIVEGDCTGAVQELFETKPPETCDFEDATSSLCDGVDRVGVCANGRRARKSCTNSDCPSANYPKALGCRIEDEQATCECGCDDAMPTECSDNLHVTYCSGIMQTYLCNDRDCTEAGYGPSLGCMLRDDGTEGCACETL